MQSATARQVAADCPCLGCGYSLRGLADGSCCPECGRSADESLAAWRSIDHGALRDIREVATVLAWIPIGLTAALPLGLLAAALSAYALVGVLIFGLLAVLMIYGSAVVGFLAAASRLAGVRAEYWGCAAGWAMLVVVVAAVAMTSASGGTSLILLTLAALAVIAWTAAQAKHICRRLGSATGVRRAVVCSRLSAVALVAMLSLSAAFLLLWSTVGPHSDAFGVVLGVLLLVTAVSLIATTALSVATMLSVRSCADQALRAATP